MKKEYRTPYPAVAGSCPKAGKISINKFLSEAGVCARRKADGLIRAGRVSVNGTPASAGVRVATGDVVRVDGARVAGATQRVYLAYHKPVGVICTADLRKKDNIINAVGYPERIFPIGRLDVASSGLMLLTNDGDVANRMMHPRYAHEKEYAVTVNRPIDDKALGEIAGGVRLDDGVTKRAQVRRRDARSFSLTITEGRNRQVRRMCAVLGFSVVRLHRVRIGAVHIGNLRPGQWQRFTPPME